MLWYRAEFHEVGAGVRCLEGFRGCPTVRTARWWGICAGVRRCDARGLAVAEASALWAGVEGGCDVVGVRRGGRGRGRDGEGWVPGE